MNKLIVLAVLMIALMAGSASAFVSAQGFTGRVDNEYTTVVAGSSITAGMWVTVAVGTELTLADVDGFDTCAIGVASPAVDQGVGVVIGVALQSVDTGSYCQVQTRGIAQAYVDATDTTSTGVIAAASPLAQTDARGSVGATAFVAGIAVTAAQAAATNVVGYTVYPIATAKGNAKQTVYIVGR